MKTYIAYCGLDCEKCEARLATINNDDKLREMINCTGCRIEGVKTPFCGSMCPIRRCAKEKNFETCGSCSQMRTCEKLAMITDNDHEIIHNLEG